jgi:hypothetical protein
LAEVLEDNHRGVLLARDELSGWLSSFQRYKGKAGGSDLPHWLEAYRAGPWIIDRKSAERKTSFIPRAAVSITGGLTPGILGRALSQEFLDAGGGARLLMAMPPTARKRWSDASVAAEVERAYESLLDRLFSLESDKDGAPLVVRMNPEARECWIRFFNQWAQEQANSEGELAAAYSKLEGCAARFALIHHVVANVARGKNPERGADDALCNTDDAWQEITPESVQAGAALAWWFGREARRIYTTLSETTEVREARRLIEVIQGRGGEITARELQRSNCRKYHTAEDAEAALNTLEQAALGVWIDRPTGPKGGQPTRTLRLHPTHDTTDTTPSTEKTTKGTGRRPRPTQPPTQPRRIPVFLRKTRVLSVLSCVGQTIATQRRAKNPRVSREGVPSDSRRLCRAMVSSAPSRT